MRNFRVRVFMSESYWADVVIPAENWIMAQMIGVGQSPISKAQFLGEAY